MHGGTAVGVFGYHVPSAGRRATARYRLVRTGSPPCFHRDRLWTLFSSTASRKAAVTKRFQTLGGPVVIAFRSWG